MSIFSNLFSHLIEIFKPIDPHNPDTVGKIGEKFTYDTLRKFFKKNHIFRNIYLKNSKGKTCEIDLLAVDVTGIYVFESKNYSGTIYGNGDSSYWIQYLGDRKYSFYNPVLQNISHIKTLRKNIPEIVNFPVYSYVVFSERCTLKIEYDLVDTFILNRYDLSNSLKNVIKNVNLSTENLFPVLDFFNNLPKNSAKIKQKHILDIQENLKICPFCGDELVKRYNKKDKIYFYGCKKFPKCCYTAPCND